MSRKPKPSTHQSLTEYFTMQANNIFNEKPTFITCHTCSRSSVSCKIAVGGSPAWQDPEHKLYELIPLQKHRTHGRIHIGTSALGRHNPTANGHLKPAPPLLHKFHTFATQPWLEPSASALRFVNMVATHIVHGHLRIAVGCSSNMLQVKLGRLGSTPAILSCFSRDVLTCKQLQREMHEITSQFKQPEKLVHNI